MFGGVGELDQAAHDDPARIPRITAFEPALSALEALFVPRGRQGIERSLIELTPERRTANQSGPGPPPRGVLLTHQELGRAGACQRST
jgi:hypothetical protein